MVSMETVRSRFSNCHLQFDACMYSVWTSWNREIELGFNFLTMKFAIWESNNKEIGLDIFIPEWFIVFRTKVFRDTLIYSSIYSVFSAYFFYIFRPISPYFIVFFWVRAFRSLSFQSPSFQSPSPGFVVWLCPPIVRNI